MQMINYSGPSIDPCGTPIKNNKTPITHSNYRPKDFRVSAFCLFHYKICSVVGFSFTITSTVFFLSVSSREQLCGVLRRQPPDGRGNRWYLEANHKERRFQGQLYLTLLIRIRSFVATPKCNDNYNIFSIIN